MWNVVFFVMTVWLSLASNVVIATNQPGFNDLHQAVWDNEEKKVEEILNGNEQDAKKALTEVIGGDEYFKGLTALQFAVHWNRDTIVAMILAYKDKNVVENALNAVAGDGEWKGLMAQHIAAMDQHEKILELLLKEKGIDLQAAASDDAGLGSGITIIHILLKKLSRFFISFQRIKILLIICKEQRALF